MNVINNQGCKDLLRQRIFVPDVGQSSLFESMPMSCRVVDGIEDNEPAFHFNVEPSEVTSNRRAKGRNYFCFEFQFCTVF